MPPAFSFANKTATTELSTLSLHDALPISEAMLLAAAAVWGFTFPLVKDALNHVDAFEFLVIDRKSTRLNSSHITISYAVFCLKKKRNRSRVRSEIDLGHASILGSILQPFV